MTPQADLPGFGESAGRGDDAAAAAERDAAAEPRSWSPGDAPGLAGSEEPTHDQPARSFSAPAATPDEPQAAAPALQPRPAVPYFDAVAARLARARATWAPAATEPVAAPAAEASAAEPDEEAPAAPRSENTWTQTSYERPPMMRAWDEPTEEEEALAAARADAVAEAVTEAEEEEEAEAEDAETDDNGENGENGEAETEAEADVEGEPGAAPGEAEARKRRSRGGRRRSRSKGGAQAAASEPESFEEMRAVPNNVEIMPLPMPFVPQATGPFYMPAPAAADDFRLALFCDFENIAIGLQENRHQKFDIEMVLERLLEKGKIVVKRAYADWERYGEYKRAFHEAGVELIEIPKKSYSGKNSADIRMVVDAMDLSSSKGHINCFVVISGDSDFSPLVSKLKENDRFVIGMGVKNSSSEMLINNCDEFIYYEDVVRGLSRMPTITDLPKKKAECFTLLVESIKALKRENKDVLWGSMVKQTMQRKKPSFNEEYYGYDSFSTLLEDAQAHNIVKIKRDTRSGTYVITGFAQAQR